MGFSTAMVARVDAGVVVRRVAARPAVNLDVRLVVVGLEHVGAEAAVQRVRPGAPDEHVVAVAPGHRVVAGATVDLVVAA
jgi:hypothetical protein